MIVQEIVAYCGLTCISCPIYWATREQDYEKQQKMRTRIAQLCNEHYGSDLKVGNITDCDGCRTETGSLFAGCRNCEIRKCARQREFLTCAHCPEYICEKLQKLFDTDPTGKFWLEAIKSMI